MRINKRRLAAVLAVICSMVMISCGSRYKEKPFGGMNGRVQKVTVYHLMPEVWYANFIGTDVMYVNTSIYDVYGNEICSADMDSALRVQGEAESLFEDGVSVRSVLKAGDRVVARINLISRDKNTLVYNKEMNGRIIRMTVKESSFLRWNKSVVTEDGKVTTVRVIRTDRHGYPVKITTKEPQKPLTIIETNKFDDKHNVIEKHVVKRWDDDGQTEEEITFIEYGYFDDHGNWKDCRTYNDLRLPVEVLVREIEYWE